MQEVQECKEEVYKNKRARWGQRRAHKVRQGKVRWVARARGQG